MNIAEVEHSEKSCHARGDGVHGGGCIISYQRLGRLEDPEFTIEMAQVVTFYPGDTARKWPKR